MPPSDMAPKRSLVVTGSSGFVGRHMVELLSASNYDPEAVRLIDRERPRFTSPYDNWLGDICTPANLAGLGNDRSTSVIHLAAEADVVTPWNRIGMLLQVNNEGTYNVLDLLQPRLLVFPSTCAVYGNAILTQAKARWSVVNPLSLYGLSKATGEMLCRDWTHHSGRAAVIMRLGNVVGPGCRGLIPYLVRHARKHPDGFVPVQMRGYGKLLRDYVPVAHVARLLLAAAEREWKPGSCSTFNIGTGRGTSNGEVGAKVSDVLSRYGYKLNIDWNRPEEWGESRVIVPNPDSTTKHFEIDPPTPEEVDAAIEAAVVGHLEDSPE